MMQLTRLGGVQNALLVTITELEYRETGGDYQHINFLRHFKKAMSMPE